MPILSNLIWCSNQPLNNMSISVVPLNLEENNSVSCRICYDSQQGDLIKACKCTGTLGFTHEACLKNWLSSKFPNILESHCEICGFKYKVKVKTKTRCGVPKETEAKNILCCKLIVSSLILSVMIAILCISVFCLLDFETKLGYSISVLIVVGVFMAMNLVLLARYIVKMTLQTYVLEWTITLKAKRTYAAVKVIDSHTPSMAVQDLN
jgi:hypothetical protein